MFPITPYTNITMVKEWPVLRDLVCSMEKVWVLSSKRVALPLLSKGAKIAAPHVLKAAKGIGRELVGQLLDGSAMTPIPRPRKKVTKRKITTKKTISMTKPKPATSDIF